MRAGLIAEAVVQIQRVAQIDPVAARAMRDLLLEQVLQAIADGHAQPDQAARAALKVFELAGDLRDAHRDD
jgi:hypothetical protein